MTADLPPPIEIVRHEPSRRKSWDAFVRGARNGHFIFERDFIEYHGDRFDDCSLVFMRGDRIVLLLPAHRREDALISHDGLPFAGMIAAMRTRYVDVREGFDRLGEWMVAEGLTRLVYKPVPWPYHSMAFEDDLFELHRRGARLVSMKHSTGHPGPVSPCERTSSRKRFARYGKEAALEFRETEDLDVFWPELEAFLVRRGYRAPVHTREEFDRLRRSFPRAIRMVFAICNGKLMGGQVVFLSPRVMRYQYSFRTIAGEASGLRVHALMSRWIARSEKFGRPWIDLGTSMDPNTGDVQESLILHKEGLGARGVVVAEWEWKP